MKDAEQRLWGLVAPYVAAEDVELDDIEVLGNGRMLRIVLDAPGGIGIDRLAELSSGISRLVDAEDPIDAAYTLEVTSPGLERKLRRPAQFAKAIGRTVDVKTAVPVSGEKRHRGTLLAADDDGFTIDEDETTVTFSYGEVASVKTVFVWDGSARTPQKAHEA